VLDAFKAADQVLLSGVQGITDLITTPGLINLDFADVKSVMSGAGSALMGIGSSRGEDRAVAAAEMAISSPLLEASIDGAHGVLLSIQGGSDLGLFEINEAAQLVSNSAAVDANIIFGAVIDDALGDEVRVTVIAAGFDENQMGRTAPGAGGRNAAVLSPGTAAASNAPPPRGNAAASGRAGTFGAASAALPHLSPAAPSYAGSPALPHTGPLADDQASWYADNVAAVDDDESATGDAPAGQPEGAGETPGDVAAATSGTAAAAEDLAEVGGSADATVDADADTPVSTDIPADPGQTAPWDIPAAPADIEPGGAGTGESSRSGAAARVFDVATSRRRPVIFDEDDDLDIPDFLK
jgi:cell division protein FtsZ